MTTSYLNITADCCHDSSDDYLRGRLMTQYTAWNKLAVFVHYSFSSRKPQSQAQPESWHIVWSHSQLTEATLVCPQSLCICKQLCSPALPQLLLSNCIWLNYCHKVTLLPAVFCTWVSLLFSPHAALHLHMKGWGTRYRSMLLQVEMIFL